jgi:hypothetical protein
MDDRNTVLRYVGVGLALLVIGVSLLVWRRCSSLG